MAHGSVERSSPDRVFGPVTPDAGGAGLLVHRYATRTGGLRPLEENQPVEFTAARGPEAPRADRVRAL